MGNVKEMYLVVGAAEVPDEAGHAALLLSDVRPVLGVHAEGEEALDDDARRADIDLRGWEQRGGRRVWAQRGSPEVSIGYWSPPPLPRPLAIQSHAFRRTALHTVQHVT